MGDAAGADEQDVTEEQDPGDEPETESGDDVEEIEAERKKRLAAENRPENAEVDNTQRDFDPEKGVFTDSEGYEEAEPEFVADEDLTG